MFVFIYSQRLLIIVTIFYRHNQRIMELDVPRKSALYLKYTYYKEMGIFHPLAESSLLKTTLVALKACTDRTNKIIEIFFNVIQINL